ncbi:MAG: recombination mediator RecR [Actinomycetota bacterium]|nr:recombination mediator RecR [Actinomycetota bacterium]
MAFQIKSIETLINEFRKLPGIGPKSARRIVFYLLKQSKNEIKSFADALIEMKEKVKLCKNCFNLSEDDECFFCKDGSRNKASICIVEKPSDVLVIEATGEYKGLYHVLGGLLSPIENIGPDELKIPKLIERINNLKTSEIIIALNPTVEGDSTATYLSKNLKPLGVKITKLASGLPVGGDIEYADQMTIGRAISGRREI